MEIHIQNRKKGFTLAELLVVVAIVSILTAISIPIFTRQLETSREATDLANVRSAYAEVMAAVMNVLCNQAVRRMAVQWLNLFLKKWSKNMV